MSNYTYGYTEKNGYKKMYLSKQDHNEMFPCRKISWKDSYHYLVSYNQIVVEHHVSWIAVIAVFILIPVHILLHGITNAKEVWEDTVNCIPYYAKKRGKFGLDSIPKSCEGYGKFMAKARRTK